MVHIKALPTTVSYVRISTLERPTEIHFYATTYSSRALSGTQRSQAEPCRPVWQPTLRAPFRARRAVDSRTRASTSGSNQVGRAVPSRAAAYPSSAFSGAQSSRQPHTSKHLPRKSSRQSIAGVCDSIRIQRPFGRAEHSVAAHERTSQVR